MAHIPRHDEILSIVSRLRSVTVGELTERLNVSEVTIRKDLSILEDMGAVVRTHGGAKLAEDRNAIRPLATRLGEHTEEKQAISARAKKLVSEGDTVYIDTGSTCLYLARHISDMNIRVVTNSLDVMNVLADAPGVSLISIGGGYRKEAGSFLGPAAEEMIRSFRIETCFIGATGISKDGAFSAQNVFESQLKRLVLSVSKRRVVLADSSKFDRTAFSVYAEPGDVDVLIVDSGFEHADELSKRGIEVIAADESEEYK